MVDQKQCEQFFFFFDTKSSASIQKFLDIESRKQQQKNSFLSIFKVKIISAFFIFHINIVYKSGWI